MHPPVLKSLSMRWQKFTSICLGIRRKKEKKYSRKRGCFAALDFVQKTLGKNFKEEKYLGYQDYSALVKTSLVRGAAQ